MADINDVSAVAGATARTVSTRDRILREANQLFARHGFSRVSMRAVATAASVTKPALYYYFKDKETLFEECLREFNREMAATMHDATRRGGDPQARLQGVAAVLLAGSPFHPVRVHDELAEHVSSGLRRRLRASFESMVTRPVTELFAELARQGHLRAGVSPQVAATVLIGVCMACLRPAPGEDWTALPGGDPQGVEAAAMVADVVLRGVGA